jgi:hypothetical protein
MLPLAERQPLATRCSVLTGKALACHATQVRLRHSKPLANLQLQAAATAATPTLTITPTLPSCPPTLM